MLEDLDEIDWKSLRHAYGTADDVPRMLRNASRDDPESVDEAMEDLFSSIFHQGTVYSATAPAVPFLVELALRPLGHRLRLLRTLGSMADREVAYGDFADEVCAAVDAQAERLLPVLDDPDPQARAAAAYALGQCRASAARVLPELHRRDGVESDPLARASLLLAVERLDPGAASAWADRCLADTTPATLAAAALVRLRSGRELPPAVPEAITTAWAEGEPLAGSPWPGLTLDHAVDTLNLPTAAAVLTELARRGGPDVRYRVAFAVGNLNRRRRSAPAVLLPLLRGLLTDTDADVRREAASVAAEAGTAAAPLADELATLAAMPLTDPDGRGSGSGHALKALLLIGDRRWRRPVLAAWAAGRSSDLATGTLADLAIAERPVPVDDELLEAVCARLDAIVAGEPGRGSLFDNVASGNEPVHLAWILKGWGPDAAPAVPTLVAALRRSRYVAADALGAVGAAAAVAVPELRSAGDSRAALAVWRLTGDATPMLEVMRARLGSPRCGGHDVRKLLTLGPAALPLVPQLTTLLEDGTVPTVIPHLDKQVAAATVVWRLTGDAAVVLPTVRAALGGDGWTCAQAAKLAGDLGEAAAPLVPSLRAALDDRLARVEAAEALWRLGADPEPLVEVLLAALTEGWNSGTRAIDVLVRMRATRAATILRELADRDQRLITSGSMHEILAEDEAVRVTLRQAADLLSSEQAHPAG